MVDTSRQLFIAFKDNKFKFNLYKKLSYYGQYNHQYKLFKFSEFINRLKHIKNPVSLFNIMVKNE